MNELQLLRALLIFGSLVAPLGTDRCLLRGRPSPVLQGAAALCFAAALLSPMAWLSGVWFLYRGSLLGLYLVECRRRCNRQSRVGAVVGFVPFLFSAIAATWVTGATLNLRILDYGELFSLYAAVHSTFLGWILVGAIAVLAATSQTYKGIYQGMVLLCLGSFLLIAFGIDGLAFIKPIGVAGLSFALPGAMLVLVLSEGPGIPRTCATLSLTSLVATMALAWLNEFGLLSFDAIPVPGLGAVRTMTSVHGLLNATLVAPMFLLSVITKANTADQEIGAP